MNFTINPAGSSTAQPLWNALAKNRLMTLGWAAGLGYSVVGAILIFSVWSESPAERWFSLISVIVIIGIIAWMIGALISLHHEFRALLQVAEFLSQNPITILEILPGTVSRGLLYDYTLSYVLLVTFDDSLSEEQVIVPITPFKQTVSSFKVS